MANRDDQVTFTRGDLGLIASFVFAFFALLSIVAFIYEGEFESYITVLVVLAVVGLVGWVVLMPREVVDFVTGRQARQGTLAIFSTVLFTGIVVMFYIFIERQVITFDLTEAQSYTLSDTTEAIIDRINRDIRIIGFYSAQNLSLRELEDQYWRQYEVVSDGRITRQYIDPIEQPAIADAYNAEDGDVFLAFVGDDGNVLPSTISFVPITDKQERDMSTAISRLLQQGNFTAYFDVGFGQSSLTDGSAGSLSIALQLLSFEGWQTVEFDLGEGASLGRDIPDDASVVVLANPTEQYPQAVVDMLDRYLAQGGALYILADVDFTGVGFLSEGSILDEYLWQNWGLRAMEAVVVDDAPIDSPSPLDVMSFQIYDSPITAGVNVPEEPDSNTQFRLARPIQVDDTPPVNNGQAILSSPYSYAETNLTEVGLNDSYAYDEGEDIPGQMVTVAFAENADTGGRVLMVGDSDFATNGQIRTPIGNGLLFVGAINWLSSYDEQVTFGFETGAIAPPTIFISPDQLDQINFILFIFIPGFVLLIGASVWYVRSRR